MKKIFTLTLFTGVIFIVGCAEKTLSQATVGEKKYLDCVQQENDYLIQYSWHAPRKNGCCGNGAINGVKEIWKADEGKTRMLVSSEPMSAKEIQKKFCSKEAN